MPERRQAPRLGAAPEDRSATRRSRHRNAERWVARPPVGADREQRYGQQMATIYTCAAICKPGHVLTRDVSEVSPSKRCTSCGAAVLTACTSCGSPIQGDLVVPGVVAIGFAYDPPDFCHECGTPFPWVGRQGRIYELENLLDDELLDPADELAVREQLQALAGEDLDARRWKRVKKLAPELLQKGTAQRIFESVASASIRSQLGL